MSTRQSTTSGGIGLCGATFIVFLACKLTGHIDWSWWWVTAPLWMPIGIFVGAIAVVFLCIGIAMPFAWLIDRRRIKRAREHNANRIPRRW